MNTILDFTDINKMTRIIQEKFPSSFVLYSLNNEEMINEGYNLANREIGYRIENLK